MAIRNENLKSELNDLASEVEAENVFDLLRKAARSDKKMLGYINVHIMYESTVTALENEQLKVESISNNTYRVSWTKV